MCAFFSVSVVIAIIIFIALIVSFTIAAERLTDKSSPIITVCKIKHTHIVVSYVARYKYKHGLKIYSNKRRTREDKFERSI